MSAAEVWHRLHITVRDRLRPPAYVATTPEEAGRRLFSVAPQEALAGSRLHRLIVAAADRALFEPELAQARALLDGRWSLFGHDVKLDDPPRWNRNAITGQEWPDASSRQIDYRYPGAAGAPRYAWEVGRLTTLPTLALAARLTGDRRCADRAVAWLDDWTARNPLAHGIHHTSTLEMAIRVVVVCWTLALLGDGARRVASAPCLGLLAQQALFCRDHLSLGSSANNHLLAEYAGMVVMGAIFPALRGADALLERGLAGIEGQMPRQFHPDGVNAEQAFGYVPYIWELLLYAFIAAEAAGRAATSQTRDRLRASLEFARTVRLTDGRWPQVGDEDDSRLLLVAEGRSRLDLVGNALAAWLGADGLSEHDTALAALLFGRIPPPRLASDGVHRFASGGYTVWRADRTVVVFDHGPLGLGPLAAHGHADALSLTVFRGQDAVVIDPGTLAYHEDLAARDRSRSTPYHSTVHFGGRSQSEMLGPFLWGRRARVTPEGVGFVCRWATGERHQRTVSFMEGHHIEIVDVAHGADPHVVFVLPPAARVTIDGARASVAVGGTHAIFDVDGSAGWRAEPGEYAPRFGTAAAVS